MTGYEDDLADWDRIVEKHDTYPELQQLENRTLFVMCKYCERDGLHWGVTKNGKWRLYSGKHVHHCEAFRRLVDEA